jgi:hypothetical protein
MRETESNLSDLVKAASARFKWSALLAGLCWWLAVCLGLWLVLFLCDNLLSLPAGLRLPLAAGGAVYAAVYFFRKVLRLLLRRQSPERTALLLEARYGIRDNLLINAVQFQRRQFRPEEVPFAAQTIAASEQIASRIRVSELWDRPKLRVWGGAATVVLLLWAGFIVFFPRQFTVSAARYVLPLSDVPPVGDVALTLTPAGDVTVAEGENLDVAVDVAASPGAVLSKSPLMVWQENSDIVQPVSAGGQNALMSLKPDTKATYLHTFANIQTPFAFRVFSGDAYSRSVAVKVLPAPRLHAAAFRVTPPAYTGQKPQTLSGPPAPLLALVGSTVEISFGVEPPVESVKWLAAGTTLAFEPKGSRWTATLLASNAGSYEIDAAFQSGGKPLPIARGDVQLIADNPPEVDFLTADRNRLVQFGRTLQLDLQARDDFGVAEISVLARPMDKDDAGIVVKRWTYLGPPGDPGPLRETLSLQIDPRLFESGASYYLEALARDFRPGGAPGRSRPIVLRVKSPDDMALAEGDPLTAAFASLQRAAASQEKANRLTANLQTYMDDVIAKHGMADQSRALAARQNEAAAQGRDTLALFGRQPEGAPYAAALAPYVNTNMPAVENDLRQLDSLPNGQVLLRLTAIARRQDAILAGLLDLLGQMADARSDKLKPAPDGKDAPQPPALALEDKQRQLLDEVKDFVAAQERILERSRTLADKGPMDLTQDEKDNLGELAREEEKWSKFFEEKLTDFSKLPQQDFADASMAQEINSVFQEVQAAADALTQTKIELAVPHEQSGLENAHQIENNLERWLPDAADNIKWSMEEPLAPADIALAQLPKELEDIVGDLLDKEEAMTPDVEDVTSSWMDSADKGAGWGAGDGPISDMSARGVTGNLLPNQNEVGGRSGEGRTGRSHGQMVSDTAEGKGGRETPTRLDPEPYEQGSVKDSAKNDQGGATGGGKLSGFAGEGLRGPAPPPSNQKMPRLADRQARIRQQAEALALSLRRYHVSGGDLESSVNAMNRVEDAARKNDGLTVRRAFSQAVSALGAAKKTVDDQVTVRREQDKLPPWVRDQIRTGAQDAVPKGYEDMVAEYYRALAEGRIK